MNEHQESSAREKAFKGRGLTEWMLDEFTMSNGILRPILDEVLREGSGLELEIRHRYVNIYYRGGNLMRIRQTGRSGHPQVLVAEFDKRYLERDKAQQASWKYLEVLGSHELTSSEGARMHIDSFDARRAIIDVWPKGERAAQQEIVRVNNAIDSEYLICDIEHAVSHPHPPGKPGKRANKSSRIDLVAVYRPYPGAEGAPARLALIELKDGVGAVDGTDGLRDHVADLQMWLSKPGSLSALTSEMGRIMVQKHRLGLVPAAIERFDDSAAVDYIIAVVNHNPHSQRLRDAILGRDKLGDEPMSLEGFDVKIAIVGDDHVLRHDTLIPLDSITKKNVPLQIFDGTLRDRRLRATER